MLLLGLVLAASGCVGGPHPLPPGNDVHQGQAGLGGGYVDSGSLGMGTGGDAAGIAVTGAADGGRVVSPVDAACPAGPVGTLRDAQIDKADAGVSCHADDAGALAP